MLDNVDDAGTDDDGVGAGGGDGFKVDASGDAEADREGDGGEGAKAGDEFGKTGAHGGVASGTGGAHLKVKGQVCEQVEGGVWEDTYLGHDVDEGIGDASEELYPPDARARCNQGDVRNTVGNILARRSR